MNGIHKKIKKCREDMEMSHLDMATKLNISERAYRNFENGITKLDYDRLKSVALIFEIEVDDLINADNDGTYIAEIKNNNVGHTNNIETVTNSDKELYERIIAEKDERIKQLVATNEQFQRLLEELKEVKRN